MTAEIFDGTAGATRRELIGTIFIRRESDLPRVRDRVRLTARELGFDNVTQIKLATVASELTRNIYEYAQTGQISVSLVERGERRGLEMVCEDRGPGIRNVELILAGNFHSSTGLGKGIAGSQRLMDEFRVHTAPGEGTRVEAIKWFDDYQRMQRPIDEIRRRFFSASEASMVEELQAQNSELVRVLAELTRSRHELERANRDLQEANEKLRHVDEMKSRFISTIAHEVRTPLNALTGLLMLLSRDKDEPLGPRQRETVSRIEKSTQMLIRLVNDLLDLSRLQARRMQIKLQAFDAGELIDAIATGLKQTATDKGVELRCEIGGDLPKILSDPTKVAQVVTNFASNAIKFTPPGGAVVIHAARDSEEMWRVEVIDTGIGIHEEQIPLIFEEFQQVNLSNPHHGGGTGLGLPISKRLVELLGGRISVQSAPGEGSTFTAIWPLDVRGYVPASVIAA
ncbi:MAG TPA: ATP-binding protein [Blastocatellia bacterium]|nr:ATP-binding protein [Blastocatellia bacterium]